MRSFAPSRLARRLVRVVASVHLSRDGSRVGRSFAVTLLTPVRAGEEVALRDHLDALAVGPDSPLARLPYVHFGRWVVLDRLDRPDAPVRRSGGTSPYLLFIANVTAPAGGNYGKRLPGSFFEELCATIPDEAEAIWQRCIGWPGIADFAAAVAYLARSQVGTSLFHVGYIDATVAEVRKALAAHDAFLAFVRDHQSEQDAMTLQRAYQEESPSWSPSR